MSKLNLILISVALCLSGCFLPEKPASRDFTSIDRSHSDFTVYSLAKHLPPPSDPRHGTINPTQGMRPRDKNLLFITADQLLEAQFQPMIAKAYNSQNPPTLNELSWWQFLPMFRDIYQKVIYLPLEQAKYQNILESLQYLESLNQTYDVIILSHGLPNHLGNGGAGYFLSFKEIDDLKDQLPHLNLVFTQGCYSSSLAKDWLGTGAKTVISFEGLNRNFFFIGVFIDRYRYRQTGVAFQETNQRMLSALNGSPLYSRLINEGLGMSVEDYLSQVDEPVLQNQ